MSLKSHLFCCVDVVCGDPPSIPYGMYAQLTEYVVGSKVEYSCMTGFKIGGSALSAVMECSRHEENGTAHGLWIDKVPTCVVEHGFGK